jgi:glycosyltransferase involved in cell wall biosynthesis
LPDQTFPPAGAETKPTPAYSAVIPVFNSADIVEKTVDACVRFFDQEQLSYEIILVDDGSTDRSWEALKRAAAAHPTVTAAKLLRNYGQHSAVHCGLAISRGNAVIVLDDDLQNHPQEILHLMRGAETGADVVFAKFRKKQHSPLRRLGSWVINHVNTAVFRKPRSLVLTNFKLIDRRVVDRILEHRSPFPYINGLAVMYAQHPVNVLVEHAQRSSGSSNYGALKLAELISRILFNYSAFPLRLLTFGGMALAALSLCFAAYVLIKAVLIGTSVPGWASIIVMLAFFNGTMLLVLGVLGEYLLRILNSISMSAPYHVVEIERRT